MQCRLYMRYVLVLWHLMTGFGHLQMRFTGLDYQVLLCKGQWSHKKHTFSIYINLFDTFFFFYLKVRKVLLSVFT